MRKVLKFLYIVFLWFASWAICAFIAWCICRIFGWPFLPWTFTPVWALLCCLEDAKEQREEKRRQKQSEGGILYELSKNHGDF